MKWTMERPALISGVFDKTCPQQRHRNIGEIEIEQNARRYEECARQKFAKVPVSPSEIEAPDTHDDGCSCVEGNIHASLTEPGGARWGP